MKNDAKEKGSSGNAEEVTQLKLWLSECVELQREADTILAEQRESKKATKNDKKRLLEDKEKGKRIRNILMETFENKDISDKGTSDRLIDLLAFKRSCVQESSID